MKGTSTSSNTDRIRQGEFALPSVVMADVALAVAQYNDCRTWRAGNRIFFVGYHPDPAVAMMEMIAQAKLDAWWQFRGDRRLGSAVKTAFERGFIQRLSARLLERQRQRRQLSMPKRLRLESAYNRARPPGHDTAIIRLPKDEHLDAYAAGKKAADKVGLSRPAAHLRVWG